MPRIASVFVGLLTVGALSGLATVDWVTVASFDLHAKAGLFGVIVMSLLSEAYSLRIAVGKEAGRSSITFLPLIAAVLLFGPPGAVLCAFTVALLNALKVTPDSLIKSVFNISQLSLSAIIAGTVFERLGGVALGAVDPGVTSSVAPSLLAFAAFGVTFLVLNQAFVSIIIGLVQRLSIRAVAIQMIGRSSSNLFYDILILPVALVVAVAYLQYGVLGFAVCLLPLLFIRHAYWANQRLAAANRDLLAALVKAIETRDPYTSGHSLRVSMLARRTARHLGLPERRIQEIETAALLHDIGKIDPDCATVLSKKGTLTHAERRAMESHVEKGVDLLTSLSSLPKEVIAAVRHHHERVDGRGYPDGLMGPEIPLGSRIIKVCDAIDAMLSDRPYRRALPLETVRSELVDNSGTQFDRDIVKTILTTDFLEEHVLEVAAATEAVGVSETLSTTRKFERFAAFAATTSTGGTLSG